LVKAYSWGYLWQKVFDCKAPQSAVSLKNSVMDLSRIRLNPNQGLINVLIEIPAGSKNKYEFDKDLEAFALDRVLYASVQYPYDYGFVPNT
jgi:inorganic pyrophosphatase